MRCRTTYKCEGCGKSVDEEDSVWMNKQGYATTKYGNPYHTECGLPEVTTCVNCGADDIGDWEHHLVPIFNGEGEFVKFVCRECGNDPTIKIEP